jgi:hypothetical protein
MFPELLMLLMAGIFDEVCFPADISTDIMQYDIHTQFTKQINFNCLNVTQI